MKSLAYISLLLILIFLCTESEKIAPKTDDYPAKISHDKKQMQLLIQTSERIYKVSQPGLEAASSKRSF